MRRPRTTTVVLLSSLLAAGGSLRLDADAFELLEEVRSAYHGMTAYHDHGEIEVVEGTQGPRTVRFETSRQGDAFRLLVEHRDASETFRRLLWSAGGETRLYDLELAQYRQLPSLGAGLVEVLGQTSFDALVVATAVAGSPAALSDPDAAALEGTEPCGDSTCDLLLLSRLKSTHESLLWIDRESSLIRRLEVIVRPAGDTLQKALADAGIDETSGALSSAAVRRTFRVRHDVRSLDAPSSERQMAGLLPPAQARQVETWERPAAEPEPPPAPASEPTSAARPALHFDDTISVELIRVTTRVVDGQGHPLLDLQPPDFQVLVEEEEVPVVSVDWVSSDPMFRDELLEAELARHGVDLEPVEKRLVFFVQAGIHSSRIRGHLRTLPFVQEFVDSLQPDDRVAVVSFDSHLKLWLDFTRRHDEAREILYEALRFGNTPHLERQREGAPASLARHLDLRDAKDAASPEQALEVLGRALQPISGDKIMVYVGWGMGRFGAGGVTMTSDYSGAVRALHRARTTVFVLDVTYAGYHSLEIGLRNVAAQTGGTYAKTSLFARQATDRLARTLLGHYVLTLSTGDLGVENGLLKVRLREKKGHVVNDTFRVEKP